MIPPRKAETQSFGLSAHPRRSIRLFDDADSLILCLQTMNLKARRLAQAQSETFALSATRLPSMLAAVDMGSNSFRMVIARVVGDELRPLDRLREGVRLAECLDQRQ